MFAYLHFILIFLFYKFFICIILTYLSFMPRCLLCYQLFLLPSCHFSPPLLLYSSKIFYPSWLLDFSLVQRISLSILWCCHCVIASKFLLSFYYFFYGLLVLMWILTLFMLYFAFFATLPFFDLVC